MDFNKYISDTGRPVVAKLANVSVEMVRRWCGGVPVSAEKVLPLAEASGYEVKPNDIRPDLYPNPKDGLPDEMRCQCEKQVAA